MDLVREGVRELHDLFHGKFEDLMHRNKRLGGAPGVSVDGLLPRLVESVLFYNGILAVGYDNVAEVIATGLVATSSKISAWLED